MKRPLGTVSFYITDTIPADKLILTVYDSAGGTLNVVATADSSISIARSDKVSIPSLLQK